MKFEIGQVLFIDTVGYSKLLIRSGLTSKGRESKGNTRPGSENNLRLEIGHTGEETVRAERTTIAASPRAV
jgi:hypothetical protein